MRAVVQRVSSAHVTVHGHEIGKIGRGLLVFVAVGIGDDKADVAYLADKILGLRLFEDDNGKMNLSLVDTGGDVLVVSQFTLLGDCRRGRRPSFDRAEIPKKAREIYGNFVASLRATGVKVETGEFQAVMDVELVNDGPVTLLLDSTRAF